MDKNIYSMCFSIFGIIGFITPIILIKNKALGIGIAMISSSSFFFCSYLTNKKCKGNADEPIKHENYI